MIIRKHDENRSYKDGHKVLKNGKIYKFDKGEMLEDPANYTYEINLKIRRRIK